MVNTYTNGGDPVNQLLGKLSSVKQSGSRWYALCPAHDDSKSSLQIAQGRDGRALVVCFAGCPLDNILSALSISKSDLFVQDKGQSEPDVIYTYHNADGGVAYQVIRKPNKQFVQRHPNGGGKWVWNMEGVKRVPYHLPELLRSDKAHTVCIVEGEKDADRLALAKVTATTNSGGAGKWSVDLAQYFEGRHVAIYPDNDEPGEAHALSVAHSLYDVAASVKIVRLPGLPRKGDVSDWLDQGHTIKELAAYTVDAAVWDDVRTDPDPLSNQDSTYKQGDVLRAWEADEPPPRRFAVAGLVPDGAVTLLYGDGGQGKSYIALALATVACLGQPFLGRFVEKRRALYIDAELEHTEFMRRAYKIARGYGYVKPPVGLQYLQIVGSVSDRMMQEHIRAKVAESEAEIVIFDSLSIASYGADANDASDMIGVLKFLEGLGCPVLALDHITKPMQGVNLSHYRAFGSVFKGNVARSTIQVIKAEGGALTLLHKKSNFAALSDPLHLILDFQEDTVRVEAISAGDERLAGIEDNLPAVEQVLRELGKHSDGARPEFLSTELGKSLSTIKNHLSALHKQHKAAPTGDGTWRATY